MTGIIFADEAGDAAWNYDSVLNLYRRIEDWHGAPDPKYRGTGGPMFIQPLLPTSPMARAMFEGALSLGIPTFENRNGRMMEGDGGCSLVERQSLMEGVARYFAPIPFPTWTGRTSLSSHRQWSHG
jgi:choline dehydrogenase-like flavoprotein